MGGFIGWFIRLDRIRLDLHGWCEEGRIMDVRTLGRVIVAAGLVGSAVMIAIFLWQWTFDGIDGVAAVFWIGRTLGVVGSCCALSALLDIADSAERRAHLLEVLVERHPAPPKPEAPRPRPLGPALDTMKDFQLPMI
jgi:hypothetical protein